MVQRTRKPRVTVAALALAPARSPLDDPRVARLTERFLELRRDLFRNAVDTVVEVGEILPQGRALVRGQYGRWLERLGLPSVTATRYVQLYLVSRDAPAVIQRWKELGPSKLYRVARMAPGARHKVLRPSRRDELLAMNDAQFASATAAYLRPGRPVTPEMRAHGLRMKLQAWSRQLRAAPDRVGHVQNVAMRRGLRDDLRTLARLARQLAERLGG